MNAVMSKWLWGKWFYARCDTIGLLGRHSLSESEEITISEVNPNLRRFILPLLVLFSLILISASAGLAQDKAAQDKTAQDKTDQSKKPAPQTPLTKPGANLIPTGEQLAESAVYMYGTRGLLDQIRRNGIERGRITRRTAEGQTEQATYERRFVRGADSTKDKIRIDQKMPTMEYSLVFGEGRLWGIINGSNFTPRQDAAASFMSQQWHSIDALLRYKENGSTPTYVDRMKQKGIDLYVLDLTDKEQRKTRYYISASSLRVLWLEYEEPLETGGAPVKYTRTFHDYRVAQGTLVPYRTVLLADNKELQEINVSSVTYGIRMDDGMFQNPEAQANSNP